ncbi:histidine kinase dimerization/phospho-acceptor domain-containing protein [Bacillus sp. RO1]|uniref:sensor histidine kinase n=1 Tax=Bacillus sp. RO1 TaxID=2722703 RepID=UPI001456786E|nr:histidine kinase dimerization/phospho-acceptor domain-containing protein [Bacillus sp. RO1]NLP51583.1 GHKL domain-containing protein [Bacillus sp. RO1]
MGTRWRNRIVAFCMSLVFVSALSGSFYFIYNLDRFNQESYFKTEEFQQELAQYANYLITSELGTLSEESVKEKIHVSMEEIEEHRYKYGSLDAQLDNIRYQYEERLQLAEDGEISEQPEEIVAERDEKLDDIQKNFSSDEHVEKKIRSEKEKIVEEYFARDSNFDLYPSRFYDDFQYFFEQGEKTFTNTAVHNSSMDQVFNESNMLYVTKYKISGEDYFHSTNWPYEDWLYQTIADVRGDFEGTIGVPKELASDSELMTARNSYEKNRMWFWRLGIASLIVLLIWFVAMIKVVSIPKERGRWQTLYDKIPVDLSVVVAGISALLLLFSLTWVHDCINQLTYSSTMYLTEFVISIFISTILSLLTYVQLRYLFASMRRISDFRELWKSSLFFIIFKFCKKAYDRIYEVIKEAFLNTTTGIQVFILLALVFGLGFGFFMIFIDIAFFLLYFLFAIFIGVPTFILLVKSVGYFNKISIKTEEMASGKLGEPIEVKGNSILSKMAANLNVLNQGVKVSLNEQAKSERLKTELITNVSHDLRTPLTSIITYTELLKKNDLTAEDRSAYLEIIDRKSQRLKGLIEDLFEVSKMASGNIELVKERVDLNQLLQQALAEYDDSLKESNLQFRVANTDKPLYAMVDGQKLWRVFDNLIGNIVKYSLEHSRVYIQVQQIENKAKITFKNVSKYELNDQSEELYERFKRGDTSRHTDGSGLGLAIAKSIIDLHEGSLDIETDGDLFKVNIGLRVVE